MYNEFHRLLGVLRREEKEQQRLFDLLLKERSAIVRLNQPELDELAAEKSRLLSISRDNENEFRTVVQQLGGEKAKLSEVVQRCSDKSLKVQLSKLGEEIKLLGEKVREVNDGNGRLLKQALGLVSSTLSIIRSVPGSELPTYNGSGAIQSSQDPAFSARRSSVRREA